MSTVAPQDQAAWRGCLQRAPRRLSSSTFAAATSQTKRQDGGQSCNWKGTRWVIGHG
jgi:hypothetical protein